MIIIMTYTLFGGSQLTRFHSTDGLHSWPAWLISTGPTGLSESYANTKHPGMTVIIRDLAKNHHSSLKGA